MVRHCLFIECKKSSKWPWVIFTSQKTAYDKEIRDLDSKGFSGELPGEDEDWLDLLKIHPFWKSDRRGRSYFEAFKNAGSDVIFKALTTAVKAAIAAREEKFAADKNSLCFYLPLIVFNGQLLRHT